METETGETVFICIITIIGKGSGRKNGRIREGLDGGDFGTIPEARFAGEMTDDLICI